MASLMETRRRILLNTPHLETLTDSLVSFETDVPADLKEHKLYIEPIQDLHGYDHPWPEGGGKNKCPLMPTTTSNGVTFTQREDGGYSLSGTANGNAVLDIGRGNWTLPAGTYYGSITGTRNAAGTIWKIVNGTASLLVTGNGSFTLTDTTSIFYRLYIESGKTASGIAYVQVEVGSSATTFTPYSNICPISGRTGVEVVRCGKNLFSQSTFENVKWATRFPAMENALNDLQPGTYTISYTSTVTSVKDTFTSETVLASTAGINILCNGKSVTRFDNDVTRAQALAHYSVNKSFTFTISSEDVGKIEAVYTYGLGRNSAAEGAPNGALGAATFSNIQIELGSTATLYEPYQAESYDITFPSEAGTVYGGTLDVKTGELTVTHGIVDMGDLEWIHDSFDRFYTNSLADVVLKPTEKTISLDDFRCSALYNNDTPLNPSSVNRVDNTIALYRSGKFYTYVPSFGDDVTAFKTFFTGQTICYKFATPITYQLTPHTMKSLRGVNNIWSDTSVDTQVRFWTHKKEG